MKISIQFPIDPKKSSARRIVKKLGILLLATLSLGFLGTRPTILDNKKDIKAANADTKQIDITNLPIQDYPFLSKFSRVNVIVFWSNNGRGATDEKLKVLSQLYFTNLVDIGLVNARRVTDEGISALSNIKSLHLLGLEGSAITDNGLEIIANKMKLHGLNVSNCSRVSKKGLEHLTHSTSLREVTFSADGLSQDDVLEILSKFKRNVTYVSVLDLKGSLDKAKVKAEGAKRQIKVVIQRKGALQNFGLDK